MTLSLDQALRSPIWDQQFWDSLTLAENEAKKKLLSMWDEGFYDGACNCETCVVKTVLEAVWPIMTEQIIRLYSEVQTIGSGAAHASS